MAADPLGRDADRKRIDVGQSQECAYWSEKFGVSTEELRQAVAVAGPMVDDVERQLGVTAGKAAAARLASSGSSLRAKAQRTARDVKDFAAAKAQKARQASERAVDETMEFIAKRPVVSVLAGVALGYALGWLASGAARNRVEKKRRAAAKLREPRVYEKHLRVSEWPRRRSGRR